MLVQAAALGITTLAASGDLGFQGCSVPKPGAMFPSSSPLTTSVGGTDLTLTAGNEIADQVVWSTFATDQGVGTGGGPSQTWGRPGFQLAPGIGPELQQGKPTRLAPDVAAMASFVPGLAVYDKDGGGWGIGGGTSAATPITAAIAALALEQERKAGGPGSARCRRCSTSSPGGPAMTRSSPTSSSARARRTRTRPSGKAPPAGPPSPGMTWRPGSAR